MEEIRVRSWAELNDALYHGSWRGELVRFRSPLAFRGFPDARVPLHNGLRRLGVDGARLERRILANFRKYAHHDSVRGESVLNWLALAQHHGLPTRLLDWTYSPWVAAHFATAGLDDRYADTDGVVWCVDYVRANRLLPPRLRRILQHEGAEVFTAEMLTEAATSLARFDRLARRAFVLFFEPPSLDQRIVNQFALFSVMSDAKADLTDWLERRPALCRRVVIPADVRWEVRDKLDQANVSERVLFPGLDGLARWLRRYYAGRGAKPERPRSVSIRQTPVRRRAARVRRQRTRRRAISG